MTFQVYSLQQQSIDLSHDRFPAKLTLWRGNSVTLPANGTHFGYIYQGQPLLSRQANLFWEADISRQAKVSRQTNEAYKLHPGMYFSLPGEGEIEGKNSSGIVVTRFHCHGMFNLGGPIEPIGRFAYIDGGTNSVLMPPIMRGDPCLNAMYFPPNVDQTLHTHPSYRIGIVVAGRGKLENQQTVTTLKPGVTFLIPAESLHKFCTTDRTLTVVVFHPDSEIGFTHQENPMLERTIVNGVSAAQLPQIQTKVSEYQQGTD